MEKGELNSIIIKTVILAAVAAALILGHTWMDKALSLLILLTFIGFSLLLIRSIIDTYKGRYVLVVLFILLLGALYVHLPQFRNIVTPVVSSNLVELRYDLLSPDFVETGRRKIKTPSGKTYVIERIDGKRSNRYRINLPHKISSIELFSTSYDGQGASPTRVLWSEDIDYYVGGDYIESRHQLNEGYNRGKGKHMLIYNHRTTLLELLRNPTKVIKNQ